MTALPITATLHKTYGQDGGVTLRTFGGKLVITHVDSNSEATEAGLKRGLEVLSMNNVDCSVLSEASAQKLLQSDEMVTFLLSEMGGTTTPGTLVTAVLVKQAKEDMIGLGLKLGSDGSSVCVGKTKGQAAETDLKTGMILKSINNFDCVGLNTDQAGKLLTEATGTFTVLAQVPDVLGSMGDRMTDCVTATVEIKDDDRQNAGPGLDVMMVDSVVDSSKMILIKSIDADGPYYGSGLRLGMQVLKIQNVDCTTKSGAKASQVQQLLCDASQVGETVMVLARECSNRRETGSLLTVVITKESADTKLGVVLAMKGGKLVVRKINDGSLGSTSELEEGMIVHSINNITFGSNASTAAATLLKETEGALTFVCQIPGPSKMKFNSNQLVAATIVKDDLQVKTGLGMTTKKGALTITKITEDSLTAETPLQPGMKIILIGNVDVTGKTAKEAAALLNEAEGEITILAKKPDLEPGSYVVAHIKVPMTEEGEEKPKVGLKFKPSKAQAAFTVTGITEDSLAAGSDLEEGMLIKSVNNVDVATKKSSEKVLDMFKVEPGSVLNVLAVVPGGTASLPVTELVTGAVENAEAAATGALEYDEEAKKIMVTEEGATGFFYGTAVRAGMEILSINNIDASVFSKAGLEVLLKKERSLVVLAKRQPLPKDLLLMEVVEKENANVSVGIGLLPKKGKLIISSIKDGSLASNTKLLPGMELLSIDNEDVKGMDPVKVAKILLQHQGKLSIVASTKEGPITKDGCKIVSLVTAVIEKTEKESRVGVAFVRRGGKLTITKIAEDGLATESDLLVGMEVLLINNVDVTEMPASEAAALMTEPTGSVHIVAKRPILRAGAYITAAIAKESPTSSLGIKLGVTKSGTAVVKSITSQSPASFTELEAGMVIKSIDNIETTKMPAKEVAKLLATEKLTITILAQLTAETAVGRASFTSMRSLSGAESLAADTIATSMTEGDASLKASSTHKVLVEGDENINLDDILESPEDEPEMDATPKKATKEAAPMVSATPDMMETITIVQGGRRQSLEVKNVVDC